MHSDGSEASIFKDNEKQVGFETKATIFCPLRLRTIHEDPIPVNACHRHDILATVNLHADFEVTNFHAIFERQQR